MQATYERLLASTKDGIYRYAFQDGCIIHANQGFLDILDLDLTPDQVVGKCLSELMVLPDEEEYAVELALEEKGELHGYTYHFRTLKGDDRWIIHDAVLVQDQNGRCVVETIVKDITTIKRAESLLRTLAGGVMISGPHFFESLVTSLAAGLRADCVFIGENLQADPNRIRTIAFCRNGKIEENFEYDVFGTPCEAMRNETLCLYPENVTRYFPNARRLVEWNVSGFAGVRLISPDGRQIGVLVVTTSGPLPDDEHIRSVLELCGMRAGTEMERDRTAAALKENEAHFRRLLSSVTNYVYTVKIENGRPVSTTHGVGCETVTGYTPEEYDREVNLWYRMIHEDDTAMVISHANRILTQPGPLTIEHRLIHRDGSIHWVRNTLVQKYDANGNMIAYDGIVSDITERKDAELALKESEARHRGIVETAAEGIWWVNEKGETTFANEHMAKLLGFRVDQMQNRNILDFMDQQSRIEAQRMMANRRRGVRESHDFCFITADGSELWTIVSTTPIIDAGGVYRGALAMVTDITERKKNEMNMARLAAAVDAADESIVITNAKGEILFVNPCFERVTGFKRDEVIGQPSRILQSGKHTRQFYADLWSTISGGGVWHGRFTNHRKDKTIIYEDATISPVRDANGQIANYVAVKRDISKEVMLEEEVRQAQKLTEIGILSRNIAHKLINKFTSIIANGGYVEKYVSANESIADNYKSMMDDVGWCAKLCQELLAFAVKQKAMMHPQKINLAIKEAQEILKAATSGEVQFFVHGLGDNSIANYDLPQIKQVLVNMVNNAKDVTPSSGCITVESAPVTLGIDIITQVTRGSRYDSHVRAFSAISISDSGRGISRESMKRLYEPFFTTTEGNLGLGLPVCYGIVKQHGGLLTCYSREGYGTTFTFFLPLVQQPPFAAVDSENAPPELCGKERILVLEDNHTDRIALVHILKMLGYSVVEAESSSQAVDAATRLEEDMQILLTDAVMPLASGIETAKTVLSVRPAMKVLYYSGFPPHHIANHPILKDVGITLSKPFTLMGVARAVRNALDGSGQASVTQ